MKIIAIFLLANIGCILGRTIEQLNANATKQLESIVEKYKYLATENAELSQWIKKLFKASKGNAMLDKMKLHAQFLLYDERRKYEEGRIKSRVNAIDDLIKDTKISQKCLKYYRRQKKSLQMAYKFSNKTKLSNILKNSKTCDEKDESNEENDEYSYY
ncbi:uncharacterized protein LOC128263125 [Drosophila gunungcola]|uniref:Seminal fluid protein n=1 Tax=Drosophila gunungcola TaxID=103775 RepID=A0A9P9YU27_9MUSC|nr:uncharacterized protein LOC128263125 [Drosophila gunungcola]KAI8043092.1 hypothetical protein M5D96_004418 [Drosophila gunungcola]